MDLETENRIAAILMKEAAELRREAEKEGVLAYLKRPTVRGRPNSRFLTATVRGVQQANKAVEVNEMWRARQKELELDNRIIRGRSRDESRSSRPSHRDSVSTPRSTSKAYSDYDDDHNGGPVSCSSSRRLHQKDYNDEDEGLKEEDIEEFLQSRVKRGKGSIGSRMDETGPYLPSREDTDEKISSNPDAWARRAVLGPEKPVISSRSDDSESEERPKKKKKKDHYERRHSHKHRSKDKPRDGKRKKKSRDERRKKDGKRHRD